MKQNNASIKKSIFIISALMVIAGCGGCSSKKTVSKLDLSFLKDYEADITDATSIGKVKVEEKNQLVKQDKEGNITPLTFKARNSSPNNLKRNKNNPKDVLKQVDLGAELVEYAVLDNFTFVKYIKDIDKSYVYENGTVYVDRNGHSREYRNVFDTLGNYQTNGGFYNSEIYQSFVIDNNTGYIYNLDFTYCSGQVWLGVGAPGFGGWNEDDYLKGLKEVILTVVDNKVVLTTCVHGGGVDQNYRIVDLIPTIQGENLVFTELGRLANIRDKYGQFYIFEEESIDGEMIYPEKKTIVNKKVYLNDNNEAIFEEDGEIYKYEDNFVKKNAELEDGAVFFHGRKEYAVYDSKIKKEGVSFVINKKIYNYSISISIPNSTDVEIQCSNSLTVNYYDAKTYSCLIDMKSNNILEDDGFVLFAKNNNLNKISLFDFLDYDLEWHNNHYNPNYSFEDYLLEHSTVLVENVSKVGLFALHNDDRILVRIEDTNIFGKNIHYLYVTDDGYEIVSEENYVPKETTYVLTPINH